MRFKTLSKSKVNFIFGHSIKYIVHRSFILLFYFFYYVQPVGLLLRNLNLDLIDFTFYKVDVMLCGSFGEVITKTSRLYNARSE